MTSAPSGIAHQPTRNPVRPCASLVSRKMGRPRGGIVSGTTKQCLAGAMAIVAAAAIGCATTPALSILCPPPATADVTTVKGWIGYIAAHRDDVSLVIDDGRGTRAVNNPDRPQ